ncbi:conserved hypothetical protein [Hahella chejuensis KCTC 2396]|uniref:Uncharacterized protein n=1 Tax=Hahella chejuensis (strain KCTC 2396) TaxID=349521 RepID=Q2S6P9_HAHCH|nr:hypothetical protein [Hahella chejuensis]ABC33675.1 conserved hypothetical protein [Hahella chejuensis KCTC 2396]
MSEVDEIGIRGIPKESKLLHLGDWYRRPGQDWRVVCYFHKQEKGNFRKALPIDLLPTLVAGTHFPRSSTENKVQGWTETIRLPERLEWQKLHFRDLPESLKRSQELSEQFENCFIYRICSGEKTYWLPVSELARILFFHSSEVTRAAIYQGNIWQLGKAQEEDWVGEIELSSNIPVRYMNSLQYRKFFAWLFFVSEVEGSFCSIFQTINRNAIDIEGAERWTFDFIPPDLSNCEISIAGFTGSEHEWNHVYIREIRSISGLRSPDLDIVYFSHPDDDILLEKESEEKQDGKPPKKNLPPVNIKELDPENKPKASKRRYQVKLGRSGLNFDVEPDTRRNPRHVKALPPGVEPELDELEEQPPEELASMQEGNDHGKGPRADVDNLDPPDLIDAPEKLVFFQAMLQKLEDTYNWKIESQLGDVPKKRCRSLHLVGDRFRRYCHAQITRDKSTTIQILEIELTSKTNKNGDVEPESLSTLFFRASDTTTTYLRILDELMTSYKDEGLKAMSWKRKFNSQKTAVCEYLGHPDNKIKSEQDALESWVARAAEKVLGM